MAKVKIQGHASGTGVLTVTAPNTSTDRTITLPDSTGTLATTADTFNPDAAVTINESGADVDFRVESDGLTHALFVEGGNGRVGVNTDSPDYSFHMVGDRLMTENLSNGNTGIFMRVKNGGSQVGNATIRTDNNGDITIYQGTTSEAVRLKFLAGGGICFNGDTAAANALDDYEEGTWTPALSGVTGNFNTSTNQIYTKVGRIVTLRGYIYSASSISNTGAAWRISGLPFAPVEEAIQAVGTYAVNLPSDTAFLVMAASTNSTIKLIASKDNQISQTLTFGDVGGGHIDFSITYMTNA